MEALAQVEGKSIGIVDKPLGSEALDRKSVVGLACAGLIPGDNHKILLERLKQGTGGEAASARATHAQVEQDWSVRIVTADRDPLFGPVDLDFFECSDRTRHWLSVGIPDRRGGGKDLRCHNRDHTYQENTCEYHGCAPRDEFKTELQDDQGHIHCGKQKENPGRYRRCERQQDHRQAHQDGDHYAQDAPKYQDRRIGSLP